MHFFFVKEAVMKNYGRMQKLTALVFVFLLPAALFAQQRTSAAAPEVAPQAPQKFALVIGNSNYRNLSKLDNPVNDANDISAVLQHLGFTVDKVLNGSLDQMEKAVERLKGNLRKSNGAYGFFFYAGHGVQSGGENFLIPVDANIPNENYLRNRALSVQTILDDLNDAGNGLNVVVLDACRDNPFGWSRSGTRGLAMVSRQPADSIIVYATSAGQPASDGTGRNGLFTSQLLANLATPGIDVNEIFRRTGADVAKTSGNQQVPAIYSQFFGTAYLGDIPIDFEGTIRHGDTTVIIKGQRDAEPTKYWSVGVAVGSSFAAPWAIGTVHGTIAPIKYAFLELGFDYGMINPDAEGKYASMFPYAHAAFFWPFNDKIGAYAGLGGGAWMFSYKIPDLEDYFDTIFVGSFTVGAVLLDMITVSYTLRTDFSGISHKGSIGYSYRFK